jgi:FkbM family methyltransferase
LLVRQKVSSWLHQILKDKSVTVLSGPLRGWRWLPRSGNHAYWLGKHEKDYVNAFAAAIAPGSTVFDIGAQAGYFALVAARQVGEGGHVIAFEPFPENIDFIKAHIQLNDCDNITLQSVAVGGSTSQRQFQSANAFMGHLSEPQTAETPLAQSSSAEGAGFIVDVIPLDELIAEHPHWIPDVIKIDTEGMEYWVLQGGKQFIQRHHPVIFIATHGEKNQRRTLELLESWQYDVTMVGAGSAKNADYIATPRTLAERGDRAYHNNEPRISRYQNERILS